MDGGGGQPEGLRWRRADDPKRSDLQSDFVAYRHYLRDAGTLEEFRELERPAPHASAKQLVIGHLLLILSFVLGLGSVVLLPWALVGIAVALRILNNVLHDAAHGNVVGRPSRLLQLLITAPILESFAIYRKRHLAHHAYLGDPERDPDIILLPPDHSPVVRFARLLFAPRTWIANTFGRLPTMCRSDVVAAVVFWTAALGLVAALAGYSGALRVFALLIVCRATTFHALLCFTELTDHVGLTPRGVLAFTRNSPTNWLTPLFHPFGDNYHIVHHLAPRIPIAHTPRGHKMLLGYSRYTESNQCDGYFFGKRTVVRGWVGQ
jgi:fatty acid desaturase